MHLRIVLLEQQIFWLAGWLAGCTGRNVPIELKENIELELILLLLSMRFSREEHVPRIPRYFGIRNV